jgi:hypothetical protein
MHWYSDASFIGFLTSYYYEFMMCKVYGASREKSHAKLPILFRVQTLNLPIFFFVYNNYNNYIINNKNDKSKI